jgi:hypothetical protein
MSTDAGFVLYPLVEPRSSRGLPEGFRDGAQAFAAAGAEFASGRAASSAAAFRRAADLFRGCCPDEVAVRTTCYGNVVVALLSAGDVGGVRAFVREVASTDPPCGPGLAELVAGLVPGPSAS